MNAVDRLRVEELTPEELETRIGNRIMLTYLKVKIKSLAEEARIIRKEERKTVGRLRAALLEHRVIDVRREARATQLAYGFLRGRSYRQLENKCRSEHPPFDRAGPNWSRVEKMILKYGPDKDPRSVRQNLEFWKQFNEK